MREAYSSLGEELCNELEQIDYVFVAVSTCGTLAGTSQRIKEKNIFQVLEQGLFHKIWSMLNMMII